MKAKIKIDYAEAKRGDVFNVVEIFDRFMTLDVNGKKVDFGKSEVELVAPTGPDMFSLGKNLSITFGKGLTLLRQCDVNILCNRMTWPVKKTVASKCINAYVWGM